MISFGSDLWLFDGPVVTGAAGFRFPTRMAVVRLPGEGGLWVWSPVELSPQVRAQIAELGTVRHIVAPNSLHHTFLCEWAEAFPQAIVHAAHGLTQETAGTVIHARLGDRANPAWEGTIEQVAVRGNRITCEVIFFHRPSGTTLVTDLVQHLPKGWFGGWRALVARLDLISGPEPAVPRKFRFAMTDREAAREGVRRVLAWPTEKLVMAHGAPVTENARAVLQKAFRWLIA